MSVKRTRPPLIPDKRAAIFTGGVLVVVGGVILHDAWEGRGGKTPWPLSIVAFWQGK